jgi:hypothetical protein
MTQNLECLISLDSSWKQKNWKKIKLFSFEKGGGRCLNLAKMSEQDHRVIMAWDRWQVQSNNS